jgi:hypothetical protein
VVIIPFLLSLFFASVDVGVSMLRQVMLDRAVDLAVREIRLGNPDFESSDDIKNAICTGIEDVSSGMRPVMQEDECLAGITVELRIINDESFAGLDEPVGCVDREENISPAVAFTPRSAAAPQELMLIRTCVVSDPFIRLTGVLTAMPINANGDYVAVSRGVFVNEPS